MPAQFVPHAVVVFGGVQRHGFRPRHHRFFLVGEERAGEIIFGLQRIEFRVSKSQCLTKHSIVLRSVIAVVDGRGFQARQIAQPHSGQRARHGLAHCARLQDL